MSARAMGRASVAIAGAVACLAFLAVVAPARAGSLTVRDPAAGWWNVLEDPAEDSPGYIVKHMLGDNQPDPRFGRSGQTTFTMSATNDPPTSVRVDASHRVWMVGASISGNQPQPVVARFLADGNADLRWGVQGKVQLSPGGLAVQPKDLLPLADGSVLVAGEISGESAPRAVVFHLKSDGGLDLAFGDGGLWQYGTDLGDGDSSTATSLAASSDGVTAVAIVVRGAKPGEELWSLNDKPPKLIQRKPLDENSDGEDLRAGWSVDHWTLAGGAGPTGIVPAALLSNHPPAPGAVAASTAASDPGQGGFNPFADTSDTPSAAPANVDDGLPWTWIGLGVLVAVAAIGFVAMRRRAPKTVLKAGARR